MMTITSQRAVEKNLPVRRNHKSNLLQLTKLMEKCVLPAKLRLKIMEKRKLKSEKSDHEYNCDCDECRSKYGNLPLLAQVIEEQEKGKKENEKPETSSENSGNEPTTSKISGNFNKEENTSSTKKVNLAKRTMKCTHCFKSFSHRGDLNKHLRKHTGVKPFKCTTCSKPFAHNSNLIRHLKVHSGDKPFLCNKCNKKFSRKDKLLLHQKSKKCKTKT